MHVYYVYILYTYVLLLQVLLFNFSSINRQFFVCFVFLCRVVNVVRVRMIRKLVFIFICIWTDILLASCVFISIRIHKYYEEGMYAHGCIIIPSRIIHTFTYMQTQTDTYTNTHSSIKVKRIHIQIRKKKNINKWNYIKAHQPFYNNYSIAYVYMYIKL